MVRISCVMATARGDYPMVGLPDTWIFEPTLRGLKSQTFKDFELVVVDNYYTFRDRGIPEMPFPVKHVEPKPSPYAARGLWHECNDFNTCFLHAEGELLVILGDCSEFTDPEALAKYWDYYERGYFAGALFTYYYRGEQLRRPDDEGFEGMLAEMGNLRERQFDRKEVMDAWKATWKEGEPIRDTRWKSVAAPMLNAPIDGWFYGYTSISLEAALKLNGYDELLDGSRGLCDVDMGSRLKMAGYERFALDPALTVVEHWHRPISVSYEGPPWKSNYAIYQLNRKRGRIRANAETLSGEDVDFIRERSVGWDGVTAESVRDPMFDWWVQNQPTFNLREMRLDV